SSMGKTGLPPARPLAREAAAFFSLRRLPRMLNAFAKISSSDCSTTHIIIDALISPVPYDTITYQIEYCIIRIGGTDHMKFHDRDHVSSWHQFQTDDCSLVSAVYNAAEQFAYEIEWE